MLIGAEHLDRDIGVGRAFDLAPPRPNKRSVKLFDTEDLSCDGIGSLLVNDALE